MYEWGYQAIRGVQDTLQVILREAVWEVMDSVQRNIVYLWYNTPQGSVQTSEGILPNPRLQGMIFHSVGLAAGGAQIVGSPLG